MLKKIDFINGAYSRARISGLTKTPSGGDITLALWRLEAMAAMWFDKNMDTGYTFEDVPDPNTPHNVPLQYHTAFAANLALNILADFGKTPMPTLVKEAAGAFSAMSSSLAQVRQIKHSKRHPIGSTNTLRVTGSRQHYYQQQIQTLVDARINDMYVGNVNDFTEHFDSYLESGETITSYTIESSQTSYLTLSNAANTNEDVTYRATAVDAGESRVTIVVTTSNGRKETRSILFRVVEVPDA